MLKTTLILIAAFTSTAMAASPDKVLPGSVISGFVDASTQPVVKDVRAYVLKSNDKGINVEITNPPAAMGTLRNGVYIHTQYGHILMFDTLDQGGKLRPISAMVALDSKYVQTIGSGPEPKIVLKDRFLIRAVVRDFK
ncbi:hypothetical protein LPN04_31095 [Rugamonas sp. A1-17]|nr:hypothetical protein [Rugamonas sp. A1-17]